MTDDMQKDFSEKQAELERILGEVSSLLPEQKGVVLAAMEFGHAAGYSSRTCEVEKDFNGAEGYEEAYRHFKRLLE
jgi:hypothetical protein